MRSGAALSPGAFSRGGRGRARVSTPAIAMLDVGTSKIVCLIARTRTGRGGQTRATGVLGFGHKPSEGVKAGIIVDPDKAEHAIRAAVADAQHHAGTTAGNVLVAVTCGQLSSRRFSVSTATRAGYVRAGDLGRLYAGGQAHAQRDGGTVVHLNTMGFRLDGRRALDPSGRIAQHISADLHAVVSGESALRSLRSVIDCCHLRVAGMIPAPYASALAASSEEERRIGVTCIDIGAGMTTMAAFTQGRLVFADALPIGGGHITHDIARALGASLAEAERIKAVYGSVISARSDEREFVTYRLDRAAGESGRTTRAKLTEVVRPRMAGMLNLVGQRLLEAGVHEFAGDRIVLTGGSASLLGAATLAANVLGRPVRLGRPSALEGLDASLCGSAFATLAGLLAVARSGAGGAEHQSRGRAALDYLEGVGKWLGSGLRD